MRPTRAIINLDTLDRNIRSLRELLKDNTDFMAVVKADAYGHGVIETARQALASGACWLGVAIPEEGAELREAGICSRILVLGGIDSSQVKTVVEYGLSQCVFSSDIAWLLNNEAKRHNKQVNVHLKIDTGMGRIGFRQPYELDSFCMGLKAQSCLNIEGAFTHFASADDPDKSYTIEQLNRFSNMLKILYTHGIQPKWIHAANSAAIIDHPDTHFNLVRAGISMYGYYPSDMPDKTRVKLFPVLQWETKVVHIKEIQPGDSISYGRTFIAQKVMKIATLPIGYADGYNRLLSNRGCVLIAGKKAPIVGRVCMDQFMVDVTHIHEVKSGDTAVLLGNQQEASIDADFLAEICGTISYEILTAISPRVTRVYTRKATLDAETGA